MESIAENIPNVNTSLIKLPEGLDPKKILDRHLQHRKDDLLYFVSEIARKQAAGKTDDHGFARLNREVLERVIPDRVLTHIEKAAMAARRGGALWASRRQVPHRLSVHARLGTQAADVGDSIRSTAH